MEMASEEAQTAAWYDENAGRWAAKHSHPDFWSDAMGAFCARMPDGGSVLEIGPGLGHQAAQLIASGLSYAGVDVSAAMIALARVNAPAGEFTRQSLYSLDLGGRQFDGW